MIRHPIETPADGIANTLGNDAGPALVFGYIVQRDLTCYLTDKKRISIGALMYDIRSFGGQGDSRVAFHQFPHLLLGQAIQLHPVEKLLPNESSKGMGQGMASGDLDVPVGADQQQGAVPNFLGQKLQK